MPARKMSLFADSLHAISTVYLQRKGIRTFLTIAFKFCTYYFRTYEPLFNAHNKFSEKNSFSAHLILQPLHSNY